MFAKKTDVDVNVVQTSEFLTLPHLVRFGSYVPVQPEYDDIVDRSKFNSSSHVADNSDEGATGVTPLYDYNSGKIPDNDFVSPVLLALRSGRLEPPDVDTLERALHEFTQRSADEDALKEAQKAKEAIQEARQDVLDSSIGFNKSDVTSK